MSAIYFLIPLTLLLLVLAVVVFFWAIRDGQFDDLESPGFRVLLDEEERGRDDSGGPQETDDDDR